MMVLLLLLAFLLSTILKMAEENEKCPEKKEDADKELMIETKSDASINESSILGRSKKLCRGGESAEKAEQVSNHAEDLQQVNRSLASICKDDVEAKNCKKQKDSSIPKKELEINHSRIDIVMDDVKGMVNAGGRLEYISEPVVLAGEEGIDHTKDHSSMSSQNFTNSVNESIENMNTLKSSQPVIGKYQNSSVEREKGISEVTESSLLETAESQSRRVAGSVRLESDVRSREKAALNFENEICCESAEDGNVSTNVEKNGSNDHGNGRSAISLDGSKHEEDCFQNKEGLGNLNHAKAEAGRKTDCVGGKSPTFDRVVGKGVKKELLNPINIEDEHRKNKHPEEEVLLKGSSKEESDKSSVMYLESNIVNSLKAVDRVEGKVKSEGEHFGNDAKCGEIIKVGQLDSKLANVGKHEFRIKTNLKKERKDYSKEDKPVGESGIEIKLRKRCSSKRVIYDTSGKHSTEEAGVEGVRENLEGKCDDNLTPDSCINGESGSQKSSAEDSDNSSDSEVEFTKRASNDPNFATVFSFLSLFGHLLNLPECSLDELEHCLDNCNDLSLLQEKHGLLEKLHLKLLRRLSRSCKTQFSSISQVSNDRLIKCLIKFSKCVDLDMAWDLEKFGYHVLGSEERLILLKALCEIHFDENPRFKIHFTDEYIKTDNFEALRLQPEGHDIHGNAIWYQQDNFGGFRVYSVEEDDEIGKSWKLLASTLKELDHLLESLRKKTEVNPKDVALMKRKERKEKKSSLKQVNAQSRKGRGKAKRLRRKRKGASESESDDDDENPCAHCYSNKRPDMVLLCDTCDAAYHTLCLRPPLLTIPEGDWICPYCQQLELIDSLQTRHKAISAKNKALERVSKRNVFDDIKLSNIVEADASSLRTGRHRSKIDYNFTNYHQMINDAISTEGTDSTAIATSNFYRGSSRRRNVQRRGLNNLDIGSTGSESSDYECSESENEKEAKRLSRTKGSEAAGCRRSRRLKRKYADDGDQESSESEEDYFVRRSTRRRKSSRKTYIDYESDDTPEEVILKKAAKNVDDSDEYVASGSEEDPEDILLPRRSRRMLIDEGADEDTPDCGDDEETDIDEDLCEDMERNVVSDETEEDEEELILSPSDENCDDSDAKNVDMLTDDDVDDDNDDGDSDSSQMHKNRKKRCNIAEKQGSKRSGKDIRNIMKSMREEKEKNIVRADGEQSKVNDGGDSRSGKEDKVSETREEKIVDEAEKGLAKEEFREEEQENVAEKSSDKKVLASNSLESSVNKMEEDSNQCDDSKKEEKTVKSDSSEEMDKKLLNTNMEVNEHVGEKLKKDSKDTQAKDLSELNLNRTDINKSLRSMKHSEHMYQHKEQARNSDVRESTRKEAAVMPVNDRNYQELYDRRTGVVPRTSAMAGTFSFSQNFRPSSTQLSSEETIALSSFSPTLKFARPQTQFCSQDAPPVSHLQHQKEVLRPRPFPPEQVRRPYDSFPQGGNASYSSPHNHYHIPRPGLGSLIEQQSLLPPGMHGFPRIAPPQYPGYSLSEQQPAWRPQRYPLPMQWSYPPYHNMPHQGEARQQIAHMHRPYLELLNPADSLPGSSLRSQSALHTQDTSKRSRTVAPTFDAVKSSPSQSYAAFRNMVIGPTEEGSSKKVKRS